MLRLKIFFTRLFPLVLATLILASCATDDATRERHLVLVSFDGFRHDYAERWQLVNFLEMSMRGASAEGLIPAYPSKTFPNHYTLVTGLYPGSHGLIDNHFRDPARALDYHMGDPNAVGDPGFYGGLPLWQYAQQQGLKSASYFWVGSEAPIAGSHPDYFMVYDGSVPNPARIARVIDWLRLPEDERPAFVSLYFSLVDSAAHRYGPLAERTRQAAQEADALLGLLRRELATLDFGVDLVVVSDHGMYPVEQDAGHMIDLAALTLGSSGLPNLRVENNQTQALLYLDAPAAGDSLYRELRTRADHFSVYRKQETPEHWHYREHGNIPALILAAEPGYVFVDSLAEQRELDGRTVGVHGYDAKGIPELYGIFYAEGPHVAPARIDAFDNVHVLPFLSGLLALPPPPDIDGDASVLAPLLRE